MKQRLDYHAVAPGGMRALSGVQQYVLKAELPPTLVNLVYLRISQINGCSYCIELHSNDLLKAGVKTEKLLLLPVWRESGVVFTSQERAALQWAEAVTAADHGAAADAAFDALAAQFSEKEIADLTIAACLMNAYNRLAISLRKGPEAAKGK
jgi:AhpD family alkylhydroperoxidase